jgi:replicative DNA helicase
MTKNNTRINSDMSSIKDIITMSVKKMESSAKNADGISGIPTGYPKLDDVTSGFQNGTLITIAGRPAMGKSSFALSLAKNITVDYETPTLFLSLEMSSTQLVNRLISNVCEISATKLLNGRMNDTEWKQLEKGIEVLLNKPLFIDDTAFLNIDKISDITRRNVKENGIKLVIIDYLQLISTTNDQNRTRHDELAEIVRVLKRLARELDIPIIILSQLNRGVTIREGLEGKRPQLSDLRECGAIEDDSDLIIFVHRPEYYHIYQDDSGRDLHGMAQIIVAKQRMGSTGDVLLEFKGEYTRFNNPEIMALDNGKYILSKINSIDEETYEPPAYDGPLPF